MTGDSCLGGVCFGAVADAGITEDTGSPSSSAGEEAGVGRAADGDGSSDAGDRSLTACDSSGGVAFDDDFAAGLRPAYWTVLQTTDGLFSVDDTQGDVRLAKVGSNSHVGPQGVSATLNITSVGGRLPETSR